MNWTYKDKNYHTEKEDWYNFKKKDNKSPLVYHKKWDKLFWLDFLHFKGKPKNIRAYIIDLYSKKKYWAVADDLEIVIEDK